MDSRRRLRIRTLRRVGIAALLSLLAGGLLVLIARCGPTLLLAEEETYWMYSGVGRFPARAYGDMQVSGRTVHAGDIVSSFWGGMSGEHGDVMIVWGDKGLAMARCYAPRNKHGGYMVGWLTIPTSWVLTAMLACTVFLTWLYQSRPVAWRRRCQDCGYSLRGLTSPRCPECGKSFGSTDFEEARRG